MPGIFTLGWRPADNPLELHEPYTIPEHPLVLESMRSMVEAVPMQLRTKREVRWSVIDVCRPACQHGAASLSRNTHIKLLELAARGADDVVQATGVPAKIPYELIAKRVDMLVRLRPELVWGIPSEKDIIIDNDLPPAVITLAPRLTGPDRYGFIVNGLPEAIVEVIEAKVLVTLPGLPRTHPLAHWERPQARMRRMMHIAIRKTMSNALV